jgi:hypothetical protein
MKSPAAWLHVLALLLTTIAGLMLGWVLFSTPPIIDIYPDASGNAYRIEGQPHIHKGDTLRTRIDYCKYRQVPLTIRAWMQVGTALYEITVAWSQRALGCRSEVLQFAAIPASLPQDSLGPGQARLVVEHSYRLNLFRTVTHRYTSDYFWIEP